MGVSLKICLTCVTAQKLEVGQSLETHKAWDPTRSLQPVVKGKEGKVWLGVLVTAIEMLAFRRTEVYVWLIH